MKEYQQRHLMRTILYSKVTIIFLFVAIILLLRSIVELNNKRIEVARLREDSELNRINLEEKVKRAEAKNKAIETQRGFDSYVRMTYPVVGEGEGVIVVYDPDASPVTPVRETTTIWEKLVLVWNKTFRTKN